MAVLGTVSTTGTSANTYNTTGAVRSNTDYANEVYNLIKKNQPKTLRVYNPEYTPGQTVDLSGLYNAIGNRPTEYYNLGNLQPLLQNQQTAGTQYVGNNYNRTFTLNDLQNAVSGISNVNYNRPSTFSIQDVLNSVLGLQTAGQTPTVNQAQYQTPDQIMQLINNMVNTLSPLTNAQVANATAAYNQSMQQLQDKWARQGLAASGGSQAQATQGANQLARDIAEITGTANQNAMNFGLQYANLGLNEANQLYNQQLQNAQFEQARQQAIANMMAQGYSMEDASNQFDANYQLQKQQAVADMMAQGYSLEEASRQFDAQFLQNTAQQSVANMLSAIGLNQQQIQDYINNLYNATGLDVSQNQWSQEFGLERQAQDFNRWLQTNQLNAQNLSNWMNSLLGAGNLGENSRQFDVSQNNAMTQFLADLQEQQRQFNFNNALNWTNTMGQFVAPVSSGAALAQQIGAGTPTLNAQTTQLQAILDAMGMTPVIPTNAGSALGSSGALSGIAGLLNQLGGSTSLSAWQTQQEMAMQQQQLAAQERIARMNASSQASSLKDSTALQIWQLTGVAPTGLEKYGIQPGTPYTKEAEISANVKMYQQKYNTDEGTAQFIDSVLSSSLSAESALETWNNMIKPQADASGFKYNEDKIKKAIEDTYGVTITTDSKGNTSIKSKSADTNSNKTSFNFKSLVNTTPGTGMENPYTTSAAAANPTKVLSSSLYRIGAPVSNFAQQLKSTLNQPLDMHINQDYYRQSAQQAFNNINLAANENYANLLNQSMQQLLRNLGR